MWYNVIIKKIAKKNTMSNRCILIYILLQEYDHHETIMWYIVVKEMT